MTIEEERTRLAVRKVELETAAKEAEKNANLTSIEARANAICRELEEGALNSAQQMVEAAKGKHFADLATKLGVSLDEALHLLWVETIAKNAPRLRIDMKTPDALRI